MAQTTTIPKDIDLESKLAQALDKSLSKYLNLDTKAIAKEFLSEERAIEQIELFKKEINRFENYDFRGKKLLEIGAAVGTHLIAGRKNYGIEAFGIEPSEDEFSPFKEISSILMKENNLPESIIQDGVGEAIPFPDNSFDLIYSTNVIEHVKDPKKVFSESFRVLKPGGFLQFIIPNYFSFWEGHYGIFWPCITNKFLGKLYVKLIGKNPTYVDTLQLINPFYLKRILSEYKDKIKIIGW